MGNRPGSFMYRLKNRMHRKRSSSKPCHSTEITSAIDGTCLETFLLVWLDPHVDSSKENVRTQKHLREILTCLITFDRVKACEDWLKKCYSDEKIILIVSGAYGEEIVPRIHDTSSIVAIYVYCLDVERNKIWAQNYSKVRSVQSSTDNLLKELSHNQINLENVEDSRALQIYKQDEPIYSLDAKTASLIWYQLLLEILIFPGYLKSKGTNQELIRILRQYNSGDEYGSNLIDEFERTYEPKRAVSWLIRDTPLVRIVNKALREQDINIIFALRFLLIDIHSQLIEHQTQSLNVFKLQLMSKSQMEDLKAHPGQLIVIHGFLFASTNISQLMSTVMNNDQFETVLFDIKADFRAGVAPFAFLHHLVSNFEEQTDRNVLFMCGSIFEVGPLLYENNIWKLQLRLASEIDIPILLNMKQKLKDNQNLNIIGDLLNQCGQTDKTPILFQRLDHELSKTHHPSEGQMSRQSSKNSCKLNLIPTENVSFILLNLCAYMTDFALAVLETLKSFASKFILIIDDESTIDFTQWSKQSVTIYTTVNCVSSLENLPKHINIFLLEIDNTNTEQAQSTNIDVLIGRLADEVIDKYRLETIESTESKARNKQINRIYCELRQIHEKYIIKKSPMQTLDNITPILIWLIPNTKPNEEDSNYIQEKFKKYFSFFYVYSDETKYHQCITTDNIPDLFLIIHSQYREAIFSSVRQLPNVKYVYRYGASKKDYDQSIIKDRDDLCYRLASDLMDYYGKLGEQYRTNKQTKKAREMFSKAQELCQFLFTFFPSE